VNATSKGSSQPGLPSKAQGNGASPAALSERERQFVEHFMATGNATKAAAQAGYSKRTASQIGYRLLRKVQIQRAIAERAANDPVVWTREDRQRFWTAIASGASAYAVATLRDRLKASELLGRSQADFIERQEADKEPSLLELLIKCDSLSSKESGRLEKLAPDVVRDECKRLHNGRCASLREHADRCADARWLAGERSLGGDRWRTNSQLEGKTGLLCEPLELR